MTSIAKYAFRFLIVGTIGFIVDASVLYTALHITPLSPIWARVPSFLIAAIVTWRLNRDFTFEATDHNFRQSFPRYISTNIVGLALNIGIYTLAVLKITAMEHNPILALALGSLAGMVFNFLAARFFVFKEKGK